MRQESNGVVPNVSKMCDAKASFFRPWNIAEPLSEASPARVDDDEVRTRLPYVKQEEDNESVLSVSTCEESSAASYSENETSAGSTSRRRRRRRRSESSGDPSTRSCSVNSEDTAEGSSLDMLSNFVFNSPSITECSVSATRESSGSEEAYGVNGCCSNPVYSMDYVQRMALQQGNYVGVNERSLIPSLEASAIQTATLGQSFYYGFPGVHQFPQGLYASSVEEAVELIHRQDAAAKQMKKLRPKKFRCEHCDVAFSNNGQLKGHIRIHTGERPFKCDAEGCGKSFTRNEELTRHKRIHTGLRPHSCVLCGKRFGRKDHLKKHTRTHDSRDPYRVSAAALGVFALGHSLPRGHPLPPYIYPI